MCKSITKKKKKKHDKIILISKSKLNRIEVLISKALINSVISHVCRRSQSICKTMLSYCLKCRKNTESKNLKLQGQKTEE